LANVAVRGRDAMTTKAVAAPMQSQEKGPRCPTCAAFPSPLYSMLEPRTGKTVKLQQCQCGERIWGLRSGSVAAELQRLARQPSTTSSTLPDRAAAPKRSRSSPVRSAGLSIAGGVKTGGS
jgi:hypothetical protein